MKDAGKTEMVTCGKFLKTLFYKIVMRNIKFHRLLFECFDKMYVGSEKEVLQNSIKLREFIKTMIQVRREDMARTDF